MDKKKRSFLNWLEYPSDMMPDISEINIVSRNEVSIDRCKKILLYEDNEIKIKVKDFVVKICGQGLTLKTFFAHSVCVKGEIDALFLEEVKVGDGL